MVPLDLDPNNLNLNLNGKFHIYTDTKDCIPTIKNTKNLVILNLNIRSLRKNWNIFTCSIHEFLSHVDIIVLTEINVSDSEIDLYQLHGYKNYYKCRKNKAGGGIMILCKSHLNADIIDITTPSAETLGLKIKNDETNLTIIACYRPPDTNVNHFNAELDHLLNSHQLKTEKNLVIAGDINICYLRKDYGYSDYLNTLFAHGLTNSIKSYTREEFLKGTLVKSCLDHINLRLPTYHYDSFVIENKIADHYFTGCSISFNKKKDLTTNETYKEFLSNKKVNTLIQTENWWPLLDLTNPDEIYNTLTKKFQSIYENSKIKTKLSKKDYNPWLNEEIKSIIKEKNKLWNQLKKNPYDHELKNKFKKIRNQLTQKIRKEKRLYYFHKFSESFGNPKETWKIVNELINKKSTPSIEDTIKINFKINSEEEIKNLVEKFNNSFQSTVNNIKSEMKGDPFEMTENFNSGPYTAGTTHSMKFFKLTEHKLLKIVEKLKTKSSAGPDNIRPKDIKSNIKSLKLVVVHLINTIIKTGKIPQKMKETYLRPIYKNGQKNDLKNYRPIGSISVLMKILEHHIQEQMQKYIKKHNIINKAQYGFIPHRSTQDLLEKLTTDIHKALSENKFVVATSLDLSKAFDIIDYKPLLEKLKKIGIGGNLFQLFLDYFDKRTVRVNIGKIISNPLDQIYGLIQGSILSPLLFNLYVNDLASLKLNGKILQYADDTIIYTIHTKINTAIKFINQDLNLVVKYFFNNSIKQNNGKTKVIIFKNPKTTMENVEPIFCHQPKCLKQQSHCACEKLPHSSSIKHLGILLDTGMKFTEHIPRLTNALRKVLFQSYRLSENLPIQVKRIFYFSMVESLLRYGITIYYSAPNYALDPLRKLIDRIMKVLFNDLSPEILGVMTFDNLAKYVDLTKHYYNENLRKTHETNYNLRTKNYEVLKCTNNHSKALPDYRIPILLNNLPLNLRNIEITHLMKSELKHFFLQASPKNP